MYKVVTAIIVLMAISCTHPGENGSHAADEHTHHEDAKQVTLFSAHYEYFIIYEPLITGDPATLTVHVTYLEDYSPLDSGRLEVSLANQVLDSGEPVSPGIFRLSITPPATGGQRLLFTLNTAGATESADTVFRVHDEHGEHFGEEHDTLHENERGAPGEIVFPKEMAWDHDFMVRAIRPSDFSSVIMVSGEFIAVPGEKKTISSNGNGIVEFQMENLVEGMKVEEGQSLFFIRSASLADHNIERTYLEYKNSLEKSRSEFERHRELFRQQVISEKQYLASKAQFTADSIRFYSLAAVSSGKGLVITSPADGYIHELNVSNGQYVELGQQLFTLSSNRVLLLRADLPQQFYARMDEIVSANFRPAYSSSVLSVEEMNGSLISMGSSVAENEHYLPVYFELNNDGKLLEGAFAEVYLKTRVKKEVLQVPAAAVVEEQGSSYLYIQESGDHYTRRAVTKGESDGVNVEITKGLEPGERVVTRGTMLLKASTIVSGVDTHEHSH